MTLSARNRAMTQIDPAFALLQRSLKLPVGNRLGTAEVFKLDPEAKLDYAAPQFRSPWQEKQAALTLHAQELAQKTAGAALPDTGAENLDNESAAVKAFLDYMAKSPEERYFEAFLKSRGMSAEDFEAMSPKEQQGLLKDFEDTLKQRLGEATAERIAGSARRAWL
jgi:hypothetical protein